jgi:hypothetical protein
MSLYKEDKPAAFVGLVVTAALLFAMAFTIVKLTASSFSGHAAEGGAPAAAEPK